MKRYLFSVVASVSQHSQGLIGGCAGTQMGCCADGVTQATMENGCEERNMAARKEGKALADMSTYTVCWQDGCQKVSDTTPVAKLEGMNMLI